MMKQVAIVIKGHDGSEMVIQVARGSDDIYIESGLTITQDEQPMISRFMELARLTVLFWHPDAEPQR